jgi:hypothetical protein
MNNMDQLIFDNSRAFGKTNYRIVYSKLEFKFSITYPQCKEILFLLYKIDTGIIHYLSYYENESNLVPLDAGPYIAVLWRTHFKDYSVDPDPISTFKLLSIQRRINDFKILIKSLFTKRVIAKCYFFVSNKYYMNTKLFTLPPDCLRIIFSPVANKEALICLINSTDVNSFKQTLKEIIIQNVFKFQYYPIFNKTILEFKYLLDIISIINDIKILLNGYRFLTHVEWMPDAPECMNPVRANKWEIGHQFIIAIGKIVDKFPGKYNVSLNDNGRMLPTILVLDNGVSI